MQDQGLSQNNSQPISSISDTGSSSVSNGGGGSPWDDDIDDLPTVSKSNPTIIGTLTPSANNNVQQSPNNAEQPLKVPDGIEEKVGVKVPAVNYMGTSVNNNTQAAVQPVSQAAPSQPIPQTSNNGSNDFFQPPIEQKNNELVVPLGNTFQPEVNNAVKSEVSNNFASPSFGDEGIATLISPNQQLQDQPKPKQNLTSDEGLNQSRENIFFGNSSMANQAVSKPFPNMNQVGQNQDMRPIPNKIDSLAQNEKKEQIPANMNGPQHNGSVKKIIFSTVFVLLLLFSSTVALTEMGWLSIGAERVYGLMHIERSWGGLPNKAEPALALSAFEMTKHSSFKLNGEMTLTVDSLIKSDITSPLLSSVDKDVFYARDINMSTNFGVPAIKTSTDGTVEDVYVYDEVEDTETSSATSGSTSTEATDSVDSSGSATSGSVVNEGSTTTRNSETTTVESSTVSTESAENVSKSTNIIVQSTLELKVGDGAAEAIIDLHDDNGSKINLINKKDKLFYKKVTNKMSDEEKVGQKWDSYSISTLKEKDIQTGIFNLKTDKGFSSVGERVGNEKINGVRCFKYKISELEIGDSLASYGITSDLVQGVSGDVYIGIRDKLMRRVNLQITTPVASSVSLIKLDLYINQFDIKNEIKDIKSEDSSTASVPEQTAQPNNITAESATLTGDEKRKADVNSILAALASYRRDNHSYPISNTLLKLNTNDNMIVKALVPKYLSELPVDSKTGWYYAYKSDGIKCSVSARLENANDPEGQLVDNILLYLKYNN